MSPSTPSRSEVRVDVEGRTLKLSNLDKVLYPRTGTTKGEVLNYYARIAPVLLPHLAHRAVTRIRWPHGVQDMSCFEKNVPERHAVVGAHRHRADDRVARPEPQRRHHHLPRGRRPRDADLAGQPRRLGCTCTSGRSAATAGRSTPTAW